jgi:hypothetical protein
MTVKLHRGEERVEIEVGDHMFDDTGPIGANCTHEGTLRRLLNTPRPAPDR